MITDKEAKIKDIIAAWKLACRQLKEKEYSPLAGILIEQNIEMIGLVIKDLEKVLNEPVKYEFSNN